MQRGFFTIMSAQFFSALADNALLVAALQLLEEEFASGDVKPLLKLAFAAAYVVLAPVVGAFADSMPKGRVMFFCNALKLGGCLLMLFGFDPIGAYTLVGIGAAAYSPAKYGIVTELLRPSQLVVANGWIEGLTVGATVFGAVIGAVLIGDNVAPLLAAIDVPFVELQNDSPGQVAIGAISVLYVVAAAINIFVPRTNAALVPFRPHPIARVREFIGANRLLWNDPLGKVSLTVTTLFWGAGGTLQVLVIEWARENLDMPLASAGKMPAVVAIGVTFGAVIAARRFGLRDAVKVVPLGIAMGFLCAAMAPITHVGLAAAVMLVVGLLSGFFVVPLNALLQHRGHSLMGAGQSISIQNFNENLSIVVMSALYSLAKHYDASAAHVVCGLGLFVAITMILVEIFLRRMLAANPTVLDDCAGH